MPCLPAAAAMNELTTAIGPSVCLPVAVYGIAAAVVFVHRIGYGGVAAAPAGDGLSKALRLSCRTTPEGVPRYSHQLVHRPLVAGPVNQQLHLKQCEGVGLYNAVATAAQNACSMQHSGQGKRRKIHQAAARAAAQRSHCGMRAVPPGATVEYS
jgi:hypothetical protein